ncbi:hypothetical protein [Nocardioides sp. SYSU DS0651]|uniref:hypothetical protein n=1 Tax=Nocardioides sp. SYSU DS0651 TaxID=3415955 RepID=UPI003F4B05B4
MQLTRRRRGLAASAVTALAVSGLAVSGLALTAAPAHAASDDVRLVSQLNGKASVREADGFLFGNVSRTVALVAERLDPEATIAFEYNTDPQAGDEAAGWTPIGEPAAPPGRFVRVDWDAQVEEVSLAGSSVAIRAVATTGTATSYATHHDVAITGPESPVEAVGTDAPGGYFVQPYDDAGETRTLLAVHGATTAVDGEVEVSWWRSSDGTFQGQTNAAVTPMPIKLPEGGGTLGSFRTALDISGYDAEANDGELAVRGLRDTDDVATAAVYRQQLTTVEVGAVEEVVSSDGVRTEARVLDQEGAPVVGAEVRRQRDGGLLGYTDIDGAVEVEQDNGTTETYYANTTDADPFEEGTDVASTPYTAPEYVPVATDTEVVLADGALFDPDEYAEGDIVLQVVDQEGTPMAKAGETFSYALHPSDEAAPEPTTVTSDDRGRVVVPFDASGPEGEYTLVHTAPQSWGSTQSTDTFVTGQAAVTLTPARASTVSAGKVVYDGRLAVGDEPLADRVIDLTYTRGVERAPGGRADAGIAVGTKRKLTARVRTAADGSFKVTIVDPPEAGRPAERGGILRAHAAAADTADSATTDFGVPLRLSGVHNGGASDRLVVDAPAWVAGERVEVFRKARPGVWRLVRTAKLGRDGAAFRVEDRNGDRATRYLVRLVASDDVPRTRSNGVNLR